MNDLTTKDKKEKPPEKIYLQWTDEPMDPYDEIGITWCVDKINDTDIEYIKKEKQDATHSKSASHLLTERQKEVLRSYVENGTYKNSAETMGISFYTYRNHCHEIYQRLDVESMTEAIIMAFRLGIVE